MTMQRHSLPKIALVAGALLLIVACGADQPGGEEEKPGALPEPTTDAQQINPTFEIRPVLGMADNEDSASRDPDGLVVQDTLPTFYVDLGPRSLGADEVHSATVVQVDTSWVVDIQFTDAGSDVFEELTAAAACAEEPGQNRVAILVNERVISSPVVSVECGSSISGTTQVSAGSTRSSAEELVEEITGD
ncbi:SecDF P1 head subdomain-containing protein [Nocardioides gilvus]|uniref:SecDF P1 head subdomain-containing protein n=1 Tax=Nocardioides gilvus TaxID=1735589 RepID=UPI000D74F9C7|nr:hypothetical protein [Nocardioides gilvus]